MNRIPLLRSSRALRCGVLAVLALGACDAVEETVAPEVVAPAPAGARNQAYATVARALAMSLARPEVAGELSRQVGVSMMREGRLDLKAFSATSPAGGGEALGVRMSRAAGAEDAVASALRQVTASDLVDVYFPVAAHRESWKPGDALLVAYHPGGKPSILPAFDQDGREVMLSVAKAPAVPVLVVTATEGASARAPRLQPRALMVEECDPNAFACEGTGGGGYTYTPPPPPPERYRWQQGYGLAERIIEHKIYPDVEYWFEGGPEPGVSVTSHANSPYNATRPFFQSVIWLNGGDDKAEWRTDNRDLFRWNQEYGDYFHLVFWEDDGGWGTGTITFAGKTYGYERPSSRDDLGEWTYSWNDRSLQYAIDGRGVGRWGANTGRIAFTTNYVTP